MSDIDGPVSAATDTPALVGQVGQDFIQNTLLGNPVESVAVIQQKCTFDNPRCQPLLGLLDQLGLERRESHKYVVQMALDAILEKIPSLSSDKLIGLLEETFPFISIHQLQAVPLAVLDRLYPIPVNFVKQLAMDTDVFWDLPSRVQRQVWVLDKKLLQRHALSFIAAYKYEQETWVQGLNMDIGMSSSKADQIEPQPPRKRLRRTSPALCRLTEMVGSNPDLYKGINVIFTAKYGDRESSIYVGMKEASVCACKTQLLMSLYDAEQSAVCATDPTFSLVWALDACIRDKEISPQKLQEIDAYFNTADKIEERRAQVKDQVKATKITLKKSSVKSKDGDAESAGIPIIQSPVNDSKQLGEASMCLRDPSTFHLIVHEIIRSIKYCVQNEQIPRKNSRLCRLTKILSVATESKYMFRANTFSYPDPDPELIKNLYPLLCGFVLDAKLMEMGEHDLLVSQSDAMAEAHKEVVFIMIRNEIARKVVQVFSLERLAFNDLWMAESLLDLVASCIAKIAPPALPEFAPFAFSLARRVSLMIQNNLDVQGSLWNLIVDKILLNLVDSETEAHEEILRLLLKAAPKLDIKTLGRYLDTCLEKSSKSRQLFSDRALEEDPLPPRALVGMSSHHASDEQYPSGLGTNQGDGTGDGIKSTYMHIAASYPGLLQPSVAPILTAYLSKV
jgi:hypothetical protein